MREIIANVNINRIPPATSDKGTKKNRYSKEYREKYPKSPLIISNSP